MLLFLYPQKKKKNKVIISRKAQMKKVTFASSSTWASSRNQRSNAIPVKLDLNRETEILLQGDLRKDGAKGCHNQKAESIL